MYITVHNVYYYLVLTKDKKEKIVQLRIAGNSVPEISAILEIPKSTVYRYAKDVHIVNIEKWQSRKKGSQIRSDRIRAKIAQEVKFDICSKSSEGQKVICALLYWAEGAKKDFLFANTDSDMVRLFVACLREQFAIELDDVDVSLRIYEDLNRENCLRYWSLATGKDLDVSNCRIDVQKGKKNGKLEFGMCRVRVKNPSKILKYLEECKKRLIEIYLPS